MGEFVDEGTDAAFDVVTDGFDASREARAGPRPPSRRSEPRDDGADVAAAHGDDDVGGATASSVRGFGKRAAAASPSISARIERTWGG